MTPIYQDRGKEYDKKSFRRTIRGSLYSYSFFTRGGRNESTKKELWVFDEPLYNFTISKKIDSTRQPQKDDRCRINKRWQPQEISNDLKSSGKESTNIDDSIMNMPAQATEFSGSGGKHQSMPDKEQETINIKKEPEFESACLWSQKHFINNRASLWHADEELMLRTQQNLPCLVHEQRVV